MLQMQIMKNTLKDMGYKVKIKNLLKNLEGVVF